MQQTMVFPCVEKKILKLSCRSHPTLFLHCIVLRTSTDNVATEFFCGHVHFGVIKASSDLMRVEF